MCLGDKLDREFCLQGRQTGIKRQLFGEDKLLREWFHGLEGLGMKEFSPRKKIGWIYMQIVQPPPQHIVEKTFDGKNPESMEYQRGKKLKPKKRSKLPSNSPGHFRLQCLDELYPITAPNIMAVLSRVSPKWLYQRHQQSIFCLYLSNISDNGRVRGLGFGGWGLGVQCLLIFCYSQ